LLNFLFIDKSGEGNTYYTAAVKSMLTSFHNFFMPRLTAVVLWLWINRLLVYRFKPWARPFSGRGDG